MAENENGIKGREIVIYIHQCQAVPVASAVSFLIY